MTRLTKTQKIAAQAVEDAKREAGDIVEPVTPERDLGDADTQRRIVDPEPAQLTVGGELIALFPLSGKRACKFVAVLSKVMATAAQGEQFVPMPARICSALVEDDALSLAFCRFVARAERPASEILNDDDLETRALHIDEQAGPFERHAIMDAMFALNRIVELFGVPKSPAGSETKTKA